MSLASTYEKVRPAVVALSLFVGTRYRIFGSGFCVDPTGIIVTARHVIIDYYEKIAGTIMPRSESEAKQKPLKKPDYLIVFFRRGKDEFESVNAEVTEQLFAPEFAAPNDDYAILRIPNLKGKWGTEYPYLEFADLSTVQEGDEAAISGYPLRWKAVESSFPNLNHGHISRIDHWIDSDKQWHIAKLVLDITANRGNSGGPVFDPHSGKVLGLVSSQRIQDEPSDTPKKLRGLFKIPAGMVYCIPPEPIIAAISALKSGKYERFATSK